MSTSSIWTDKATTDDRLGFDDYRRTLVRVIRGADTPITIGIFGRWGSGKTSLMRMVELDLQQPGKDQPGALTIWFDAWKYDKEEALWRALLVEVLRTLREGLPLPEKETRTHLQDLQASLYRDVDRDKLGGVEIDWSKLWKATAKGAVKISLSFLPGGAILDQLAQGLKGQAGEQTETLIDAIHREKVRLHEDQAQSLEQFQDRFHKAVQMFLEKTERPFVAVFVDDLDRCLPEKATEVLEAIKLFLDVPGCVFLLGVDPAIIEKGIESKYAARDRPPPISGDDYLEKIVQVPFKLPPLDNKDIGRFIEDRMKKEFPGLAAVFAIGLEANPRKVKRTLNIFNLLWTLAGEREVLKGRIEAELLAKVVVIQVRFRDLYADVVDYPNLLGELETHFERESQEESQLGPGPATEEGAAAAKATAGRTGASQTKAGRLLNLPGAEETTPERTGVSSPAAPEPGTLVGKYAREKPLKALLLSGQKRFRELDDLHRYIFLTITVSARPEAEKEAEKAEAIDQRIWEDLLSNDPTKIRAACDKIEPGDRKGYVSRLLGVISDARTHPVAARVSAGNALAYWEGDPRDLKEMVVVPAGEFTMGSEASDDEKPVHRVSLPEYQIGKYPVTHAEYKRFLDKAGHRQPDGWQNGAFPAGGGNHPVVNVSWNDAQQYCRWLSQKTGKPYRLPTEAEWEKAARGTDGQEYPWGNEFDPSKCNTAESGIRTTTPVGVYPDGASPYGALDMAGNVREWCQSLHEPYPYRPDDGREEIEADGVRVLRGGSWYHGAGRARCASRFRVRSRRRLLLLRVPGRPLPPIVWDSESLDF